METDICRPEGRAMKGVMRYLRKVAKGQTSEDRTDGQLLEAFLTVRDESAFETLLRRHGPMVLGVCRRILHNPDDAEDAFQATFLVLVHKAGTIRKGALVGSWLYGVACRTARRARYVNNRRLNRERQANANRAVAEADDAIRDELLQYLDAELSRLPDKYRVPVVLCELEGKSRKEAATLLGLPEGTLSSRLAWARKLLTRKLARHGVESSATALVAALSSTASASVPGELMVSTARAALELAARRALTAGVVSASVAKLTEGVLQAMFLSKLKVTWIAAVVVTLGLATAGVGYRVSAGEPKQGGDEIRQTRVLSDELDAMRLEIEALRRSLQATRDRMRLLETELQTLKQGHGVATETENRGSGAGVWRGNVQSFSSDAVVQKGPAASGTSDGTAGSISSKSTARDAQRSGGTLPQRTKSSDRQLDLDADGAFLGHYYRESIPSVPNKQRSTGDDARPSGDQKGNRTPGSWPKDDAGKATEDYNRSREGQMKAGYLSRNAAAAATADSSAVKDPIVDAEEALKEVRKQQGNTSATERLERALQRLKDQSRPKNGTRQN
jgi:RNA polymerase sigma-70 factor (ECF subfamily)